jgi:hypothetical protein
METIKVTGLRTFAAALAALFCIEAGASSAFAEVRLAPQKYQTVAGKNQKARGLAGSEGDVKRKIMFPADWVGGCKGVYQRYVAASGHSAFTATIVDYFYGGGFVCGSGFNAPSQAEAERRALAQCEAARKQYKGVEPIGRCFVYASK